MGNVGATSVVRFAENSYAGRCGMSELPSHLAPQRYHADARRRSSLSHLRHSAPHAPEPLPPGFARAAVPVPVAAARTAPRRRTAPRTGTASTRVLRHSRLGV